MSTPSNPHRTLLNWIVDLRKEETDRSIAQRGHPCLAGNYRERVTTKEMELRRLVSTCYACDTQVGFAEQERRLNELRDAAIEVIHWQLPLVGHRREERSPGSLRPSDGFGIAGIYLIEKLNALYPHIDAVEPLAAWCGSQKTVVAEVDGKTTEPTSRETTHKGKHINERMLARLHEEPTSVGWSAEKWATVMECSKSTVQDTRAWATIRTARALQKAGRLEKERQSKRRSADD